MKNVEVNIKTEYVTRIKRNDSTITFEGHLNNEFSASINLENITIKPKPAVNKSTLSKAIIGIIDMTPETPRAYLTEGTALIAVLKTSRTFTRIVIFRFPK